MHTCSPSQAENTESVECPTGVTCGSQGGKAVAVVVPPEDGHDVVAASAGDNCGATCGTAVGVAGWVCLILNAINVVAMIVACYQLNAYLNAPHPHDDSSYLAGLPFLVYVPLLVDSALMVVLIGWILHREYGNRKVTEIEGGCGWCCVITLVVLFLISCLPGGVSLVLLFLQVLHWSDYRISPYIPVELLLSGIPISFAVFAYFLWARSRPHRRG